MGCNCGGSGRGVPMPRLTKEQNQPRPSTAPPRKPRVGGPGQPGYYYTGPRRD